MKKTSMNRLVVVATVFACGLVAHAMPTKEELVQAQALVADLTADDVRALKSGKKKPGEVAAAQLALADEAETEAGKYLLLQGAFRLYARSADYDAAADVLARMRRDIDVLPPEVVVELVSGEFRRVAVGKAEKVMVIYRDALRTVRYRKELAAAEKAATAKPRDVAILRRMAECHAVLGDWTKALETFAKLGEEAAKFELDPASVKGCDASKAADFWWNYPTKDNEPFKVHAAVIYQKGLADGSITGLRKTLAEKRVKEMESVMPAEDETSAPVRGSDTPAVSAAVNRRSDTPVASATPKGEYKFNYKLDNKGNAILCGNPCVSPKPEGVLVVPDKIDGHTVSKIDGVAFKGCDKMTRIVLPSYLQDIWVKKKGYPNNPGAIFAGCSALESIEISEANRDYTSENGVLYTKTKECLIAYPKTRNQITLVRDTMKVGDGAFHSCKFKTAKIPDSVDRFACCIFSQCPNLEVVEFPKIVDKISAYAFEGSPNMKKVIFHGDAPARLSDGKVNLFARASQDIVVEVKKGSKGWKAKGSTELPERWPTTGSDSRPIRYIK